MAVTSAASPISNTGPAPMRPTSDQHGSVGAGKAELSPGLAASGVHDGSPAGVAVVSGGSAAAPGEATVVPGETAVVPGDAAGLGEAAAVPGEMASRPAAVMPSRSPGRSVTPLSVHCWAPGITRPSVAAQV